MYIHTQLYRKACRGHLCSWCTRRTFLDNRSLQMSLYRFGVSDCRQSDNPWGCWLVSEGSCVCCTLLIARPRAKLLWRRRWVGFSCPTGVIPEAVSFHKSLGPPLYAWYMGPQITHPRDGSDTALLTAFHS